MNEQWYKTNFSKDVFIKGKKSIFLRTESISKDFWVCAIPIPINNDISDDDPFSLNYTKTKDLYDFLTAGSPNKITEDLNLFNLMGYPDSSGLAGFKFPSDPTVWRPVGIGEKTDYRLDFNAEKDSILKIVFLYTNVNPANFSSELPRFFVDSYPSPAIEGDVVKTSGSPETFEVYDGGTFISIPFPEYGVKNLHDVANSSAQHILYETTNVFDYQEVYIFGYEQDENDFNKDLGSAATTQIHDRPIFEDKQSFSLLRSNPKLSGNVKLTVDSSNQIWLNSIDANDTLSNSKFKNYKLSPESSFPTDLRNFLDDGTVPSDVLFQVKEGNYENTKKTYKEQYDFFYGYGVQQLKDESYDEDLSFFAPLWLRKEIPDFFVILRLPHSLNTETYSSLINEKEEIAKNYLQDSQIIKSYDLRRGTKIGTYLRNITENSRFKELPLTVNYNKNDYTTWSGIDYKKGIFSDKVELLYDTYTNDLTIKDFEETITQGFERNNLICPNLINLEFLFDDGISEDYEINRYIGFYVNEIELSTFKLDKEALRVIPNQEPDPIPGKDGEEYSMQPFTQENDNGIIWPVGAIKTGKLPLPEHVNATERFFAIRNRNNDLLRVKTLNDYEFNYEGSSIYQNYTGLQLHETELDFSKYLGITNLSYQIPTDLLEKSASQLVFTVDSEILAGEILKISWVSIDENFIWELKANPNGLNEGEWWDYPVFDYSEKINKNTFSNEGSTSSVAKAIAGGFNEFENKKFTALAIDNKVIIVSNEKSLNANSLKFERFPIVNSYVSSISFFEKTSVCGFNYYEEENTANVSFSTNQVCPYRISTYEITFTNTNLGTPGSGITKVFATDNRNNIVFDSYVEIGESFEIDNLTVYTALTMTDGILKIGVENLLQSQQFVGGSSTSNNIARILTEDIQNVELDDWFQTKRGTYNKLNQFTIQNSKILSLYYLDEPIFEGTELVGFNDIDKYSTIHIQDDSFLIGNDKKLLGYKTYDTPLSILSFMNIRDFDFDFYMSDYSYLPVGELIRYFEDEENGFILENATDEQEIDINEFFIIKADSPVIVELWGYDNTWTNIKQFTTDVSSGIIPQFNTLIKNVEYNSSDISLFYPRIFDYDVNSYTKFKVVLQSGSNAQIIKTLFWQDPDLNNFKGFAGLRDFFGIKDEETLETLKENRDFNRFLFKLLKSEYDRLGENYLKETSFTSKVVPYINKWSANGRDIRDNKYRLNLSSAFGYTNYSPDYSITNPDPTSLTHEWSYLDEIPEGLEEDYVTNSRSYFFQDLNTSPVTDVSDDNYGKTWYELLKQKDNDWFLKYFTVGYPSEEYKNSKVIKGAEERFSFIKYNQIIDESYAIFRGVKFKIEDLDPITNEKIVNSSRYDNYKFSVITRKLDKPLYENTKPFDIEIIDNRSQEFLVVIISIYFDDFKSSKNIDYTTLYSTKSSFRNSQLFDGSVTWIDVNDFWLNYFDNETSRHFGDFQGAPILDYSDINTYSELNTSFITSYVDASGYNIKVPIDFSLAEEYGLSIENEIKNIQGQIDNVLNKDKENHWMMHYFSFGGNDFMYQTVPAFFENDTVSSFSVFGNNWPTESINKKPIDSIRPFSEDSTKANILNDGGLYFVHIINSSAADDSIFYNFGDITYEPNPLSEANTYLPIPIEKSETYYLNGGETYNEQILEKLSFANIINEINNENVTFVEIDSTETTDKNYSLTFIEYDKIEKSNILGLELDTDRPVEYKDSLEIGFNLTSSNSSDVIYRHRASFEPKTRNIIKFWVRENESMTSHFEKDFLLANTQMLLTDENLGVISNLSYNKVADSEILKISRQSSYVSQYPLVDEISIEKKDFFTFNSMWDNDYFTKNTSRKLSSTIQGVEEMKEQKSFFGSKAMKLPKAYDIHKFNDSEIEYEVIELPNSALQIKPLQDEDTLQNYPLTESGSVPSLEINIDSTSRLIRYMIESGATSEFDWIKSQGISKIATLTDEEIELLATDYLENNILELYKIDEVLLYVLENVNEETTQILDYSLSEAEKLALGYREDKNFKVENIDQLNVKITKELDTKKHNSYSIGIVLKRI